jgi:hypothetical protein
MSALLLVYYVVDLRGCPPKERVQVRDGDWHRGRSKYVYDHMPNRKHLAFNNRMRAVLKELEGSFAFVLYKELRVGFLSTGFAGQDDVKMADGLTKKAL